MGFCTGTPQEPREKCRNGGKLHLCKKSKKCINWHPGTTVSVKRLHTGRVRINWGKHLTSLRRSNNTEWDSWHSTEASLFQHPEKCRCGFLMCCCARRLWESKPRSFFSNSSFLNLSNFDEQQFESEICMDSMKWLVFLYLWCWSSSFLWLCPCIFKSCLPQENDSEVLSDSSLLWVCC